MACVRQIRDRTIPEWLAERTWPGIPPSVFVGLSLFVFALLVASVWVAVFSAKRFQIEESPVVPTPVSPETVKQIIRDYRASRAELAYLEGIVSVDWLPAEQGLHFRVMNNEAEAVDRFRLYLKDLKLWSPERQAFVEVKEFHSEGKFTEVELPLGDRKLFHRDPVTAAFLHVEPSYLWFMGNIGSVAKKEHIRREGIWQATFRHELDGRTVIHNLLRCFTWKQGTVPKPCDCPDPEAEA